MIYFDKKENQYSIKKIIKPPNYVEKEIQLIIDHLKKFKLKKIIDFGCGTGRLTIPLLKQDFAIEAVDISNQSLKKLFLLAKKLKLNKKLFIKNKIEGKNYEAIVGTDILHHIDLKQHLPLFKNKLKEKGNLCFSEPNFLNPSWLFFITFFLNWKEEWRIIYINPFYLKLSFIRYGFKNFSFIGFGLFPPILFEKNPFLAKVNFFLGNLPILKYFSYRIILKAQK